MKKTGLFYAYRIPLVIFLGIIVQLSNAQDESIALKKGNMLSFIASHFHSAESQENAQEYFNEVFPLAQKHTFKPLIRFNTLNVQDRHFMASSFGIYSWDTKRNFDDFHNEPAWPELKATRPKYWQTLRSVHIEIDSGQTLDFYADKVYRITYIWLHDFENAEENLEKYLRPMRKVIERLGGRYVLAFGPENIMAMSSLKNDRKPDRIAITEWPDHTVHEQYIASPEFKEYSKFFFSSVAEFEAFDTRTLVQ